MSDNTNRGAKVHLETYYQGVAPPANFYIACCTADTDPIASDANTLGELTEIQPGNGYTSGGYVIGRNATDWPTIVQDDVNNYAEITLRDFLVTASGGPIPASGNGIRYLVLTDDNASVSDRQITDFWDLGSDFTISDTQSLNFKGGKIRKY